MKTAVLLSNNHTLDFEDGNSGGVATAIGALRWRNLQGKQPYTITNHYSNPKAKTNLTDLVRSPLSTNTLTRVVSTDGWNDINTYVHSDPSGLANAGVGLRTQKT